MIFTEHGVTEETTLKFHHASSYTVTHTYGK